MFSMGWLLISALIIAVSEQFSTAPSVQSEYNQMKSVVVKLKSTSIPKEDCRMVPFYHQIKNGSFDGKLVEVNACQGVCKSSYEPMEPSSMSFCASVCVPTVTENRTIIMSDGGSIQYKLIKSCGCSAQKCRLIPLKEQKKDNKDEKNLIN